MKDEINDLNGSVVLISFGLEEGARKWLEDTKATFPMLLDIERNVYASFGLPRSVFKVWGVGSMIYYAEKLAQGVSLPKPYENIHDDANQMGGDFIVDKNGILRFTYCSAHSADRPDVQKVIDELRKC